MSINKRTFTKKLAMFCFISIPIYIIIVILFLIINIKSAGEVDIKYPSDSVEVWNLCPTQNVSKDATDVQLEILARERVVQFIGKPAYIIGRIKNVLNSPIAGIIVVLESPLEKENTTIVYAAIAQTSIDTALKLFKNNIVIVSGIYEETICLVERDGTFFIDVSNGTIEYFFKK